MRWSPEKDHIVSLAPTLLPCIIPRRPALDTLHTSNMANIKQLLIKILETSDVNPNAEAIANTWRKLHPLPLEKGLCCVILTTFQPAMRFLLLVLSRSASTRFAR